MDKVRILHSIKRSNILDRLNTDETKLYLILLANSGEKGDGKILLSVINSVLGEGFSIDRLKDACSILSECGLIEVLPASLGQIKDDGSELVYRITPKKQM